MYQNDDNFNYGDHDAGGSVMVVRYELNLFMQMLTGARVLRNSWNIYQ